MQEKMLRIGYFGSNGRQPGSSEDQLEKKGGKHLPWIFTISLLTADFFGYYDGM
jgi:hypothetical protein